MDVINQMNIEDLCINTFYWQQSDLEFAFYSFIVFLTQANPKISFVSPVAPYVPKKLRSDLFFHPSRAALLFFPNFARAEIFFL